MGCHFLLQGIFLTQGSNPGLLHCRQMLYPLSLSPSLSPLSLSLSSQSLLSQRGALRPSPVAVCEGGREPGSLSSLSLSLPLSLPSLSLSLLSVSSLSSLRLPPLLSLCLCPLQCSCLENPRDGGALWVAVYGVAQSRTLLKRLMVILTEAKCWGTVLGLSEGL